MFQPLATTPSARGVGKRMSGSDRQPLFLLLHLVSEIEVRIDQVPEFAIHVVREDPQPDPSCGAARPTPGASIIVSVRSCTSLRSCLSKSTTGPPEPARPGHRTAEFPPLTHCLLGLQSLRGASVAIRPRG